tara:strand:- start:356 stop:1174 length:819 start_codon:yes stop_codon:yes gene_type:complete
MGLRDSNDDFTFTIEGKDYTISEKNNSTKKNSKHALHVPSLAIGAIISGVCIAIAFFGITDDSEFSEPLIEKQLIESEQVAKKPMEVTLATFFNNGSPLLGDPDAPITLIEFGDYQCHFCNVHYKNTEHRILNEFVMTGKINVIYKDYTIIGADSTVAALGAHCAAEQGKFWEYHDTLFNNYGGENNGWAGQEKIFRFGEDIGLNMDEFIECNKDERYLEKISISNNDARSLGITGTPAFYIISLDNEEIEFISGAQPYEVFENIFNSMLEN